jgi:hypothetical protein
MRRGAVNMRPNSTVALMICLLMAPVVGVLVVRSLWIRSFNLRKDFITKQELVEIDALGTLLQDLAASVHASSMRSAQALPLRICVSQDGAGYDALHLARELSSRKQEIGSSVAVVAITGKTLSAREELEWAPQNSSFERVILKGQTSKDRSAEIEQVGCEYNVQVWRHEGAPAVDLMNGAAGSPNPAPRAAGVALPNDPETVSYELRRAGSKKVLSRAVAPPMTVFVKQGRRVFDPYSLFTGQIVKKLHNIN